MDGGYATAANIPVDVVDIILRYHEGFVKVLQAEIDEIRTCVIRSLQWSIACAETRFYEIRKNVAVNPRRSMHVGDLPSHTQILLTRIKAMYWEDKERELKRKRTIERTFFDGNSLKRFSIFAL